jgi:aspartate aminotransferase-like enzyme
MLRKLFLTTDASAQPLVVSGSGTLGWDFVAANLVEPGEEVLVLHTGLPSRFLRGQWQQLKAMKRRLLCRLVCRCP